MILKFLHTADVCRFAQVAKWAYATSAEQQVWLGRLAHTLARETLLSPDSVVKELKETLNQDPSISSSFSLPKFLYLRRSLELRARNVSARNSLGHVSQSQCSVFAEKPLA